MVGLLRERPGQACNLLGSHFCVSPVCPFYYRGQIDVLQPHWRLSSRAPSKIFHNVLLYGMGFGLITQTTLMVWSGIS